MSKKMHYHRLDQYDKFFNQITRRKSTFILSKTSYTKKIQKEDSTHFFNHSGEPDEKLLYLINNVRKDAKKFTDSGNKTREGFIFFFDLFGRPVYDNEVAKIDVNGAYWNLALNKGVISGLTNEIFNELSEEIHNEYEDQNEADKISKKIRLKALGSLATKKIILPFERGEPCYEKEEYDVFPARKVYMEICRWIDDIMTECAKTIPEVYYYYWDCVFVNKKYLSDVIEFFHKHQLDVSVEYTRLSVNHVGRLAMLKSHSDGKEYMLREDDRKLLLEYSPKYF